jgi:hypothetical protein
MATWRQPQLSRGLMALIFAVGFLVNGGLGLWAGLSASPQHVTGLAVAVSVMGVIALAGAVQQFAKARGGDQ